MHSYWRNMYLASPKRGSTFRAAGHLGISAGQCASCNNKAFLPIMDSHRFSWAGSGRILKFGPACNSGPASEWSHAGKVQQAVTVTMKCAIWDCVLVLFSTVLLSCFKLDLYCLYAIHSCLCRVYTVVFILWLLYIVTCAVVRVKSWSWSWPWNKKSRLGLDKKSWSWSWSWKILRSWSWSWSWDLEFWSWSWSWQKSLIYITAFMTGRRMSKVW